MACFFAGALFSARAATYHVDSRGGDDARDGLAPETAWRSIGRVNAANFAPGDRILLRAGSTWDAVTLQPRGSGVEGRVIAIDRYGDGARPALHGRGRVACVLRLDGQEFWEISNLEVTNRSETEGKQLRGVEIRARDAGVLRHLHFRKLLVRDVNAASDYTNDGDIVAKSFGGFVTLIDGTAKQTAWDDFLVEDCTFRDVGPVGFAMFSSWTKGHRTNDPATWFPSRRVVVRGCTFERIARNGLVVRACAAPLIERNFFTHCGLLGSGNASFAFHCDDAVFQFNEACFTKYNPGDHDAAGFDSDYNCRRTIFQFNYSHDNDYGFILLCNNGASGFNEDTIVRYNLSVNDGGNVIRFSGPVKRARIHNNTIVTSPTMTNPREGEPPRIVYHKSWSGWSDDAVLYNNIIVNRSARAVYEFGRSTRNRYDHNLFAGIRPATEPADAHAMTGDPKFAHPEFKPSDTGDLAHRRERVAAAFALRPGSPAIGAGRVPDGAGGAATWRDFAGREVRQHGGRIDLGALQHEP